MLTYDWDGGSGVMQGLEINTVQKIETMAHNVYARRLALLLGSAVATGPPGMKAARVR